MPADGQRMANGLKWCSFCEVGHSASCCHPGRRWTVLLEAERDRLLALVAERGHCSTCEGTGGVNGGPCICGGHGTHVAEVEGLNDALAERDEEVERLRRLAQYADPNRQLREAP